MRIISNGCRYIITSIKQSYYMWNFSSKLHWCVPEGDLRLVPLQTLHGISLPPQVGFQLRAKLVWNATTRPAHRPGNSKKNKLSAKVCKIFRLMWRTHFLYRITLLFFETVKSSLSPKSWNILMSLKLWNQAVVKQNLLYRLGVYGAGDFQTIKPLHGYYRRYNRLWRADGLGSDIAWRQVAILLQPSL